MDTLHLFAAPAAPPEAAAAAMLEALGTPAALLGPDGRLRRANAPCAAVLTKVSVIVQDRLHFLDRRTQARFRRAIRILPSAPAAIRLPVQEPQTALPLALLRLCRLPGRIQGAEGGGPVLMQLQMLAETAPDCAPLLQDLFGLTPREAAVAALIAQGHGQAAVALGLGIARETVKAHLKHVFDKTGCHRQGEIAALLARLARL